MKLYKRILNQAWAQNTVSALAYAYLRFVQITSRYEARHSDSARQALDNGDPLLLCFWHGRLIPAAICWLEDRTLTILSTPHRDGQIAVKTYNRFGIETFFGSTQKGGTQAARNIIKALKNGGVVGITPDGPKGPHQRMQRSALELARMSGAKLLPATCSSTHIKWLNTWDQMAVPLPFGKIIYSYGDPVDVPRKASDDVYEDIRRDMESRMNAMVSDIDSACNQTPPVADNDEAAP